MRKYFIAMTAAAVAFTAAPSMAQSSANAYGSVSMSNRITQLETRLQTGISDGTIDRAEASNIRQQLRQLTRLDRQYGRDGYTQQEQRDMQQRIRDTRQALRSADGRNARFADNDDEYYDRYTRGAASSYYPEVNQVCSTQRSGLSSVLSRVFGSDNCLRVGERASTYGMSAVPTQYGDQFRDTSSYTHRYLEGNVVQIDARTGLVTRIFDVVQ